jgi:hypothetical protein
MTRLLRRQDGNALVTALLVSLVVMSFGLATLQLIDTEQHESRRQRERESSFQLAEGVLNTQIFRLSGGWPGTTDGAYSVPCTQTSTSEPQCPGSPALDSTYTAVDFGPAMTWNTYVRDNTGAVATFWSDRALTSTPAETFYTYDSNEDNRVWVRAQATVRGRTRTLVALVEAEKVPLNLPKATLVADHFDVTNNGNKTIIDTNGISDEFAASGPVYVRCEAPGRNGLDPSTSNACASYDNDKARAQIDPDTLDYTQKPAGISSDKLELLRIRAESDGNYFQGCPSSLQGSAPGEVVWIENAGTGCRFNGNDNFNTESRPGVVIVNRGSIVIDGGATFYGLIYHANADNSADALIDLGGNVSVFGSIQVAGRGGVYAGSSKVNLVFNPNYLEGIRTFGTAGIVQNSFREIRAGA